MEFADDIAMNLLHGDHAIRWIPAERFIVAILESHDVGTPRTILVKG